jgi:hypothetical protein
LQPLEERRETHLPFRVVRGKIHEHADPPHPLALLRARRERPRYRYAAERGYEFSPSDVNCHVTLPWGSFMQWRDDITLPSHGL